MNDVGLNDVESEDRRNNFNNHLQPRMNSYFSYFEAKRSPICLPTPTRPQL